MQNITDRNEIKTTLEEYVGKRVSLTCQVGVCIWGAMFTLEPGKGLCLYDLVRDELRVGISHQIVSSVRKNMDGTLAITIS